MKTLIYGTAEYEALKEEALSQYGVVPTNIFNVKEAIRDRIDYLKHFLKTTGLNGFVLGISGGVDSSTAGRLCQLACEELRDEGYDAKFIAMRLPAGVQLDEEDAQAAIKFINADKMLTVNVGEAATNLSIQGLEQFASVEGHTIDKYKADFNKGNIKARLRMVAQYQVGAMYNAAILGTDHNTEGICGFWTKWADGACDSIVLNGLNKTQVRLVGKELGAPEFLWNKVATADLEEESPQKTDESALGISYSVLDKFLEGEEIDKDVEYKIIHQYMITQHKRNPIPGFTKVNVKPSLKVG